jgi:hypothetical protein
VRLGSVSAGRNHARVAGTRTRLHDIEGHSQEQTATGGHRAAATGGRPRGDWRRDGPCWRLSKPLDRSPSPRLRASRAAYRLTTRSRPRFEELEGPRRRASASRRGLVSRRLGSSAQGPVGLNHAACPNSLRFKTESALIRDTGLLRPPARRRDAVRSRRPYRGGAVRPGAGRPAHCIPALNESLEDSRRPSILLGGAAARGGRPSPRTLKPGPGGLEQARARRPMIRGSRPRGRAATSIGVFGSGRAEWREPGFRGRLAAGPPPNSWSLPPGRRPRAREGPA